MVAETTSSHKLCELCSAAAAVHCPSDSAYLCFPCDAAVHSANFLVARHLRSSLCSTCGEIACGSCDRCSAESSLTESSSAGRPEKEEVSSAIRRKGGKKRKRKRTRTTVITNGRGDGILVNWCRRVGLDGELEDSVVTTAERVFGRLTRAPLGVGLATSFWVGLRVCGMATCQNLIRVENITGVPAKVILAVEGRIGRVLITRRDESECDFEEGWAEC